VVAVNISFVPSSADLFTAKAFATAYVSYHRPTAYLFQPEIHDSVQFTSRAPPTIKFVDLSHGACVVGEMHVVSLLVENLPREKLRVTVLQDGVVIESNLRVQLGNI
jgi:hypothetical protein